MDKNTITGFVLIAAVLFGFSWFSRPSEEEIRAQHQQDSIAAVNKAKQENERKQAEAKKQEQAKAVLENQDTTVLFYSALNGKAQDIVLENEKLALTLSSKGATVSKAVVKDYKDRNGNKDITLFAGNDQQLNYILVAKQMNISTKDMFFTPTAQSDSTVTFVAKAAEGKTLEISYKLGKDYLLSCSIKASGMAGLFDPNNSQINIDWKDRVRQQERGFIFENNRSALTYHFPDGGSDELSETSEEIDEAIDEKIDWVAFKNQYFSAVMISKSDFADNALLTSIPYKKENGNGYLKQYEAKLKTAFDPSGVNPTQFEFYYGPNDFRLLQDVEEGSAFGKDLQLERLVYLGWTIFHYINRWFTLYLFEWLKDLAIPMGVVLILITLILKVLTYPMVKKSYMSSAKMRVLRPKLDEATKQYDKPEDQMQKQQAMMQLYSEYGVSPLSGCLPMLIQMPVWIAMFNFVPNAIQLRGESFLWMDDLSTYDPIWEWSSNIWLIGDHLSLTCILFCAANLVYSWMSMRQQKDSMVGQQAQQMKMMQYMMFLMPLMFFFIFNDYSSGLNFYYFISLFCSAAIMWTLRKTTNDEKLLAILEAKRAENKANPNRKVSGLAARMQAMQKEAEELRKKREELARKNARLRGE